MKTTSFFLRGFRYVLTMSLLSVLIASVSAQKQAASNGFKQPIPISNCGTIDKSGSYVVTADLAGLPGGPCFQIAADNVTLHVAGHSVAAMAGGLSAQSVKNLAVIGPGSLYGDGPGIELINVTNSQVVGVDSSGDGVGIHIHNDAADRANNRIVANKVHSRVHGYGILAESQGNVYLGNELDSGDNVAGMWIQGGEGDVIRGNHCTGCFNFGLYISGTHETIVGNKVDNGLAGISVGIFVDGTGNLIRNNEATGNQGNDLVDNSGVCGNNTWKTNAFTTANLPCID